MNSSRERDARGKFYSKNYSYSRYSFCNRKKIYLDTRPLPLNLLLYISYKLLSYKFVFVSRALYSVCTSHTYNTIFILKKILLFNIINFFRPNVFLGLRYKLCSDLSLSKIFSAWTDRFPLEDRREKSASLRVGKEIGRPPGDTSTNHLLKTRDRFIIGVGKAVTTRTHPRTSEALQFMEPLTETAELPDSFQILWQAAEQLGQCRNESRTDRRKSGQKTQRDL